MSEQQELEIESLLDALSPQDEDLSITPPVRYCEARRHYIEGYEHVLPENALMGLRIVIDCANGSTYRTSGELLSQLGAQVLSFGCEPDGDNINDEFGSEHPEVIQKAVLESDADLGIAHDGDGDRVIFCDHKARIINGDAVLAILGTNWAKRKALAHDTVVSTIMSNLGLDKCLRQAGVKLMRVGVGDRQVYHFMREGGYILGGESSGHFIDMNHLPTGDGLLASLLVLREMILNDRPLADLVSIFHPFPQLTKNFDVRSKVPLESIPDLQASLNAIGKKLGSDGRILVRYSGTEPKIRLLAEAQDADLVQKTLDELEHLVRQYLPVVKPTFI